MTSTTRWAGIAALLVAVAGCFSNADADAAAAPQASASAPVWQVIADGSNAGAGFADVPEAADGAFALYFEPQFSVSARSGNAYVTLLQ